jgi:hypothetical protein
MSTPQFVKTYTFESNIDGRLVFRIEAEKEYMLNLAKHDVLKLLYVLQKRGAKHVCYSRKYNLERYAFQKNGMSYFSKKEKRQMPNIYEDGGTLIENDN